MQFPHWIRWALGAAVVALAVVGCSRSAQSHLDRGNAYLEKDNVPAAVLEFRNAVEKNPMFAPARSPSRCARRTCCRPTRTPS
jgi:hypothetical protein